MMDLTMLAAILLGFMACAQVAGWLERR